ncbi:MAG: diguanylate cyclase [Kiritimatiellae bacterium]|nr:diguanylate cyclase [Kiritimatiellia bacterium]
MKTWSPLIFPFLLFISLVLIFIVCPEITSWSVSESFQYLPYIFFGTGLVLGGVFTQSRISFLCLFFASITFLADYSFFIKCDAARGRTVVLLSVIYVPSLVALLHRLNERGFWTAHAGFRVLMVLSAVLVILLLPMIPELSNAVLNARSAMFRPLSDYIRIPLIGILAFLVSMPFLIIRKQHESPFLGKLIGIAMLFVFGALNHPVAEEHSAHGEAMLLMFMSGSALTLIWAVLESSWRSARIDELTDLPGRRVLKHHMANLGPSYAIAVLDIDHFKKINDKYGHDTGDQVLRFIAMHLNRNQAGKAYRYGGEEFVIICENEDFDQTVEALERLRLAISSRKFFIRSKTRPKKKPGKFNSLGKDAHGESIIVTVSIGVAKNNGKFSSPQETLEVADKALYKAKNEGRDRTKIANN